MPAPITTKSTKPPLLKISFLSHGTLESRDLQTSRRFYEEVLGFEVIQHAPGAMMIRHGSDHVYAVVQTSAAHEMNLMNHNGLDVSSEEEVRAAHELLQSIKDEYGIRQITKPVTAHGAYTFYFQDLDGNWWEILANPPRGYAGKFGDPSADLTGRTPEQVRARPRADRTTAES